MRRKRNLKLLQGEEHLEQVAAGEAEPASTLGLAGGYCPGRLTSREMRFVLAWAVLCIGLVALPLVRFFLAAPPGTRFSGFYTFSVDYYAYLAWIRQAHDGAFLFRDLFTSEPHNGAVILPLFWMMGTVERVTSLSSIVVWDTFGAVGYGWLATAIYRFAALFGTGRRFRALALILVTTAGGFGWARSSAIDFWVGEATSFRSAAEVQVVFILALAVVLECGIHFLRYLVSGRAREAVFAGLFALAAASIHLYDLVTIGAVATVWTLFGARRRWPGLLVTLAIPTPYAIYSFVVVRTHPVFSRVSWNLRQPSALDFILGYGAPLVLAVAALAIPAVRAKHRHAGLLLGWIATVAVLVAIPSHFAIKFVLGVNVAICILAAMSFDHFMDLARPRFGRVRTRVYAVSLLVFCAITPAVRWFSLTLQPTNSTVGRYLPNEYADAFHWMDEHKAAGDVVLMMPPLATVIPSATGLTVYSGHWAQTLDYEAKAQFVRQLFSSRSATKRERFERVLDSSRVRYIVVDALGAAEMNVSSKGPFVFEPLCKLVFANQMVAVWERLAVWGST